MLGNLGIRAVSARRNAVITDDHFVYAKKADGWYHGTAYANKDAIYPFVDDVESLCEVIAWHFRDYGVDVVEGPTVGAVSLAQWVTKWFHRMHNNDHVVAVCADEEDVLEPRIWTPPAREDLLDFDFSAYGKVEVKIDTMTQRLHRILYHEKVATRRVVKRGYDQHVRGKRCLIVEDVINSGKTVCNTNHATVEAGGEVVGVGCLYNRSGGKVTRQTLNVPDLFALIDLDMPMVKEELCQTCKEKGRGSVRLDLGKGKDFLVRMGIKPGDM